MEYFVIGICCLATGLGLGLMVAGRLMRSYADDHFVRKDLTADELAKVKAAVRRRTAA